MFTLLTALLASPPAGGADIYLGTDENGIVTFTDTPPASLGGFEVFIRALDGRPASMASVDGRLLRQEIDSYDSLILQAASATGLEPELVKAVILVESGMNARATSPVGAQGLMQLMPETARSLGVTDAYDPVENVMAGCRYLRMMMDRFDDVREALAAYNAGPGAVDRYGGIPPFRETRYYVDKVMAYYSFFRVERPLGS